MMKFWPYDNFEIHSNHSLAEAQLKLHQEILGPESVYNKSVPCFTGFMTDNYFELTNYINYRNTFLPETKGEFFESPEGCKIVVRMGLSGLGRVFLIVVLGFTLIVALWQLIVSPDKEILKPGILAPLIAFSCVYAVAMFAFFSEANKAKYKLFELFMED